MVVESGLARCPRCVSVADYVFIESGTGRQYGALRYEVRCRKCGEYYGEDSRPLPRHPVTVPEPPIVWPRDREPSIPVDWRAELQRRFSAAAQRLSAEIDVMVGRACTIAPKRWFGRDVRQRGHTGG
ncbi:MAG: hypothetical protein AB7G47_15790 [Mycolicibacterium sp.]|uniref:hypothetical protein n=1 Tax=Mycolicibacterium sp. TaxID=2320850 RepID=UPI003D0C4FDB